MHSLETDRVPQPDPAGATRGPAPPSAFAASLNQSRPDDPDPVPTAIALSPEGVRFYSPGRSTAQAWDPTAATNCPQSPNRGETSPAGAPAQINPVPSSRIPNPWWDHVLWRKRL